VAAILNQYSSEDVGMSWENAIQTIFGAAFRLLEKWKGEEKERRMKHFKDIKEKCLEPLFGELGRLKEKHFTLKESEPWWCEFKIENPLKKILGGRRTLLKTLLLKALHLQVL
jgi:hypothetical protein